jgi:predicted AAA+ superfamily ATPase
MKQYKLSITMSDKSYVCNNINDEDIIIKEFKHYNQASNYIDNNFKKIKEGEHYNYYIKQQASEQKR